MAKVPVIIVQNEDIVWEIASIKLDHIPYHEIESFIRSNKTAYPNRKLLLHLKNLTLPDSEINIDYLKNMKRNRLAFECITALTKDESHFCSMEYYKQLIQPLLKLLDENSLYKNSLDKLNKYMVSKTLAEKNSMLRTITLCLTESTIDLEIFQKYPSIMWRYKILLRALILNDHSWAFTLDRSVIKKINDTIDLLEKQNRSLKIEDIFEYLLRNQKIYKFRVEILIDTLDFISKDENYNIAKYMTNLPIMVQDCDDEIWGVSLEWESTIKLITDYSNSKVISESCDHLQGYQRTRLTNLLLKYSYDMIRYFIDLIKSIDNVEITGVIQLLESLEATKLPTSNIEPFLYCLKSYNSSIWRFKFIFFITLKMISREFPVYETFMMQEELEAESIDEFNSAPKAMQNTKCYRPWGDKLSVSVTTYSNENYNTKRILKGSDKLYHLLHYLHEKLINFIIMITGDEFTKTIKIISGFISNLDSEKKIEKLANCFEIFKDYNVGINNEAILDIFNRSSCEDIEQKIHDFVITSEFPGTQSKSRDEMLQELSNLNNDMDTSHISEILSEKDRHYDSCIKHWRSYHIKEWSSRRSTTPQLGECLGVMKKAMQLTMAVRVRDSHMIAMIIMLNHDNENRGRLSQINEGEGRPIVIALLAAYLAMIGHKVDIATSSPMIAMAQSRTLTPFYEILNLSVDHIIKNPSAYSCDIVYGVHFVYQEDIYRTEYVKTQGRQNRPFDIVIIDQTENMFYNENKKLIRSTALIAGMEQLVPLLARIWVYVDKFEYTNFERNSDNPMRPSVEPNKVTEEHIIEIVSRNMSVHLRDDNRDTTQDEIFEEMKIPNHLREFVVMVGLREWILKAIKAKLYLHNGKHYIIENDLIRILEPNTERIQHDKLWSDGLYQFIAMKHKIKLIPIRLSCHYLSNVGLFCRYPRIYGFTETLGNEYHTRLLNQFYRLDSFIIPTFKQKQHKELSAIVVNQLEDWYATIVDSNMSKIRNGRGVFIITKYIEETHELEKRFQSADRTIKIKLYQTECDLQTIKSSLGPKQIIIATNLEGVSSDTKPDPGMDKNGGIHVCITYLSENSRVRIQNYQRTSREGNRGTSQFIIFDKNGHSIEHLRHIYDLQESSSFDGKFSEMRRMKTKDDTVRNFCQLLDSIDFGNNPRDRDAVEERFVIWQKTHEHILKEGLFDQYGREFEEFGRDISNKRKFINPYLVVLEANGKLLEKLKKYKRINSDKLTKAYDQYSYAIKLDENNVEYAYYNRGVIALSEDNRKIFSIDGIIRDFQRARKIMMSKIDEYDVLLHLAEDGTSLHTQCLRKIKLYSEGIKSIDIVIGYDQQILDDRINACRQIIDSTEDRQEVERRREEIEKLMEKKEIKGKILALADADTKCYMKFLKPPEYLGNDHHLYQEEIDEFASNGWWGPITISDGNRRQLYNMAKCVAIINVQIYLGIVCILWIPPVAHILGPAAFIDAALDIGRLSIRYYKERSLSLRKFFKCKTNSFLLCSMICLFVTYISGI